MIPEATMPDPHLARRPPRRRPLGGVRTALLLLVLGIGAVGAWWWHTHRQAESPPAAADAPGAARGAQGARRNVPAVVDTVKAADVPVIVRAVGTVTARSTTTVRSRVDGLLERVTFREGETVKPGDTLARIDPKPFEALVQAAQGQLARDRAQLDNAKVDLARYRTLLAQDGIARQQVETQEALVRQLEGVVAADAAQLATARLNLGYTRVTAPIGGKAGLRQVDPGNMVRAGDASGIVVITEIQPITVVFAIPQDRLPALLERVAALKKSAPDDEAGSSPAPGNPAGPPAAGARRGRSPAGIVVQALDRDGRTVLDTGRVLAIDNQIDATTGTLKVKAIFRNADERLFPNQFVNVRMVLDRLEGALTVPASAIQRGAGGAFVFAVTEQKTASVRKVQLGPTAPGERIVVESGLAEGEQVVVDGADKLREGAPVVSIPLPANAGRRGDGGPDATGRQAADGPPRADGAPRGDAPPRGDASTRNGVAPRGGDQRP